MRLNREVNVKMLKKIKSFLAPFLKQTIFFQMYLANKFYKSNKYDGLSNDEKTKKRICFSSSFKIKQLERLLSMIQISLRSGTKFQHWIDTGLFCVNKDSLNDALPPNYQLIIDFSIDDLVEKNRACQNQVMRNNFMLLQMVSNYLDRILSEFDDVIQENEKYSENLKKSKEYFMRMKYCAAQTLEEGLQRILFWSSLFWQTRHTLIGLGRLDKVLCRLQIPESEEEVYHLILGFYQELHRYYAYKSNTILGDTGQLIVLGGTERDGSYFCNKLTYAFIDTMIRAQLPDPKLLLRVAPNMPQDLLELGTRCIATGIGGPLLANDAIIIPALMDFDYTEHDACNYVTSACWETLSYGKSWGRGNLAEINFAIILTEMYQDAGFEQCNSFDEVLNIYISYLKKNVKNCLCMLDKINWEENPLMTLFTEGCIESGKDVSNGGSVYHDYGIMSVGLANAVDSLMNIKYLVFDMDSELTLSDLKSAAVNNYVRQTSLQERLEEGAYFGTDNQEVIGLVSRISDVIYDICVTYKNPYGGKVKYGFSSPNYIKQGLVCGATFDGRGKNDPLAVHISCKKGTAYTELLNFAGTVNYNGIRANASVVDFFVSPNFIADNFDKFILFLKSAITVGFFEMQMNVVSSQTLIAAQKNPQLFPNLIVRVWGFSAYYIDLPREYQDMLIKRAIDHERVA